MAYEINGKKYSYDYTDLLKDIKDDIADGILTESSIIHIARGKAIQIEDIEYSPIIDYYLLDEVKQIQEPLEPYKDNQELEKVSVLAAITEMEQWDAII